MSAPLVVPLPGLRLVSEANAHEHWRVRSKRAKHQRAVCAAAIGAAIRAGKWTLPLRVTIVRIAPRALDSDNAVGSAKHARDGIADALAAIGLRDDRDARVTWHVEQERGAPKTYGVRITLESVSE